MADSLFEKKAEFISWCIEEYSALKSTTGRETANMFAQKNVLDFLSNHYDVLHTQSKNYILGSIEDFLFTEESK